MRAALPARNLRGRLLARRAVPVQHVVHAARDREALHGDLVGVYHVGCFRRHLSRRHQRRARRRARHSWLALALYRRGRRHCRRSPGHPVRPHRLPCHVPQVHARGEEAGHRASRGGRLRRRKFGEESPRARPGTQSVECSHNARLLAFLHRVHDGGWELSP